MKAAYSENQTQTAHSKKDGFVFYLNKEPSTFATLGNVKLSSITTIKKLPPISNSMVAFKNKQNVIALFTKQEPFVAKITIVKNILLTAISQPFINFHKAPKYLPLARMICINSFT